MKLFLFFFPRDNYFNKFAASKVLCLAQLDPRRCCTLKMSISRRLRLCLINSEVGRSQIELCKSTFAFVCSLASTHAPTLLSFSTEFNSALTERD